jgi:hypothetical protein
MAFGISTSTHLAEKQFNIYGNLPKLCLFRDGLPIIYSGRCQHKNVCHVDDDVCHVVVVLQLDTLSDVDRIEEWLSETRERLTHSLDDRTFEHDTQAATGSTTGDWFVVLYVSYSRDSIEHGQCRSIYFFFFFFLFL